MVKIGTLDHPGERSSHAVPIPKGGGVGIIAAVVVGLLWAGHPILVPAIMGLGAVSYLDDVYDWPFLAKLAAQTLAAVGVVLAGVVAHAVWVPGLGLLQFGWAAPFMTVAWFVYVTNAVNFMDGLNGLASICVAVAAIFAISLTAGKFLPAVPLLAGIVGFLPFNYPRARIFMGDVGSQICGFLAAALAVQGAALPQTGIAVPLALMPMLADVAFTLLRRVRRGARITQAHRGHLYQIASRSGVAPWAVTLIYAGMTAWCGAAGWLAGNVGSHGLVLALGLVALPLATWTVYVWRRATQAGLTDW